MGKKLLSQKPTWEASHPKAAVPRPLKDAAIASRAASPSQVSLNWLLQQPGGTIPIVGARKLSHMEDNLQAVDFTLTPEQIERLNKVSNFNLPEPHNFATPQLIDSVVDGETEIEEAYLVKQS